MHKQFDKYTFKEWHWGESHVVPSSSLASAASLLLCLSYLVYKLLFVICPTHLDLPYLTYHTYVTCFMNVCLKLKVILMACDLGSVSVNNSTKTKTKGHKTQTKTEKFGLKTKTKT